MMVGSMNIRGLGGQLKKKKIHFFIKKENLDFMVVQETKMETKDGQLCEQLWGGVECAWLCLPVIGNAGGLLSLWNANLGNFIFSFSSYGFSGVCLEWEGKRTRCFVVNIYSPCNMAGERRL